MRTQRYPGVLHPDIQGIGLTCPSLWGIGLLRRWVPTVASGCLTASVPTRTCSWFMLACAGSHNISGCFCCVCKGFSCSLFCLISSAGFQGLPVPRMPSYDIKDGALSHMLGEYTSKICWRCHTCSSISRSGCCQGGKQPFNLC